MKSFGLRSLCNDLLAELNESNGKKNIIKLGVDIQLSDEYSGSPGELLDTIRTVTRYLSAQLINGIINIEITHHANHDPFVTVHVRITGLGSMRANALARYELERLGRGTDFKISQSIDREQASFEFTHTLRCLGSCDTPAPLPFQSKRILLAEDNEINSLVFLSFLEEWGCDTTTATNGLEAVSQAHGSPFPFDAILMDIHMPVLNGTLAIAKIRDFNPHVPIVALTASTREEDLRGAMNAGANDFLLKPVSSSQLFQILSQYL